MAVEKVAKHKVPKKTPISPDSVPKRLPERSLFVTASKAPDEVQPKVQADSSSKRIGPIRKAFTAGLMGLTMLSTTSQFAFAGGQDEKSKNVITKNELVSPDPTNAPIMTTAVGAYPIVGSTIFTFGAGPSDKNFQVDATTQLKGIGVDSFTPGSFGLDCSGDKIASFYLFVPSSTGIINFQLLSYQELGEKAKVSGTQSVTDFHRRYQFEEIVYTRLPNGYIAFCVGRGIGLLAPSHQNGAGIDADLSGVGILPTKKLGKDYTVEITYDEKDKLVYFDFKIGSKYVLSYQIDPYNFNKPVFKVSTPTEEPTSSINSH